MEGPLRLLKNDGWHELQIMAASYAAIKVEGTFLARFTTFSQGEDVKVICIPSDSVTLGIIKEHQREAAN